MARFTPISITGPDGRDYAGFYELIDGDVDVGSAYGSARVKARRADPDKAARAALEDLVRQWLTRRP